MRLKCLHFSTDLPVNHLEISLQESGETLCSCHHFAPAARPVKRTKLWGGKWFPPAERNVVSLRQSLDKKPKKRRIAWQADLEKMKVRISGSDFGKNPGEDSMKKTCATF